MHLCCWLFCFKLRSLVSVRNKPFILFVLDSGGDLHERQIDFVLFVYMVSMNDKVFCFVVRYRVHTRQSILCFILFMLHGLHA